MLNPALFDMRAHYINCKTVEESVELWQEIIAATSNRCPSPFSIKKFHSEEGVDVTYRVIMSEHRLVDWGWGDKRYYEARGHEIMEFNEALTFLDLGDITSEEVVDVNALLCSCWEEIT